MKQLIITKVDPSVFPNSNENVREDRAIVVGKAIWLIEASQPASLFFIVNVDSFCLAHVVT